MLSDAAMNGREGNAIHVSSCSAVANVDNIAPVDQNISEFSVD